MTDPLREILWLTPSQSRAMEKRLRAFIDERITTMEERMSQAVDDAVAAVTARIDAATTDLAGDLTRIKDQLAAALAGGDAEALGALAQLDSVISSLEALGHENEATPVEPTPDPAPEPPAA